MDPHHRITITILGDGGVGKSALTLRLVKSQWTSDYDPTIEDSYTLTRRIDGQTYHLAITDTAGQEEYRGMWASANFKSDAFLLVYDITNWGSLEQLAYFDDLIEMEREVRVEERGNGGGGRGRDRDGRERGDREREYDLLEPVKFVAGNKCDLQESREVSAQKGVQWARSHNCGFMETSARSMVNIEETFELIVRRVVEARRRADAEGNGREGEGEGAGESESGLGSRGRETLGTRRATTKPLTPLPGGGGGEEKNLDAGGREIEGKKKSRWRSWGRKLACWKGGS
ncbi:Ras family protein [Rutstroemia sp. NJR-2017a BVV2]|nr:Ras family protein [Rutstroemia sp. NJR-2017a BVV2]